MSSETLSHRSLTRPFRSISNYFSRIRRDIDSVIERDPAARSKLEVMLVYSGLHAIWIHRITHWLWRHNFRFLGRWISQMARWLTGIEIHPGATIGPGFFIDHGMGVVIGETAEVGADVTMYHGVTLGGTSTHKGKRHPTIGDRVVIGAGVKILGAIEIGAGSRIGANAVVVKSVPENSVVIGVPGQIVRRSQPALIPDLNHTSMPDILGVTIKELLQRVDELESRVEGHTDKHGHEHIHAPKDEAWVGADFSI